jgi:hypothetical protein
VVVSSAEDIVFVFFENTKPLTMGELRSFFVVPAMKGVVQ